MEKEFTYPEPAHLSDGSLGEKMIVNIGPSHPATHGVLRMKLELDGDLITRKNFSVLCHCFTLC